MIPLATPTIRPMDKERVTILQWNCRGVYRKIPELKQYIASLDSKPDILMLQETHLVHRYSPVIPGYYSVRKDKSIHSGGLAIFVRSTVSFSLLQVPTTSRVELQCIKVGGYLFYNIYIPPDIRLDGDGLFHSVIYAHVLFY